MTKFFGIAIATTHGASMRVAVIYAVFGALWILLSDKVLFLLFHDPAIITKFQTLKGWVFVIVSAGIIRWLTKRNIMALRRHDERLREIAQGISVATGEAFFDSLTKHLAGALGADCAMIAGLERGGDSLGILAAYVRGDRPVQFQCLLEGSPCEEVLRSKKMISLPRGVRQRFPNHKCLHELEVEGFIGFPLINSSGRMLGLIAIMNSKPLEQIDMAEEIIPVFAIRAAVELERKNADEELRKNEALLSVIFDEAYQLMGLLKPDGTLLKINRRASEFIGLPEAQVIGKPFWDTPWWAHSAPQQEKLRQSIEAAAAGEFVRFEATHVDAEGNVARIDFSLKPVKNDKDEVVLLVPEGREII